MDAKIVCSIMSGGDACPGVIEAESLLSRWPLSKLTCGTLDLRVGLHAGGSPRRPLYMPISLCQNQARIQGCSRSYLQGRMLRQALRMPVGPCQIDAQAAHFGGEQEDVHGLVAVEVIHEAGAQDDGGGPVHAVVAQPCSLRRPLQNVQHLLGLGEHQGPVPLLMPSFQHLHPPPSSTSWWAERGWCAGKEMFRRPRYMHCRRTGGVSAAYLEGDDELARAY